MEAIIQNKEKYIRHFVRMYPYLGWHTVDDTFSEAIFRICKYNPPAFTEAYIYTTIRNIIIDIYKKPSTSIIYCEELQDIEQETISSVSYKDLRPAIYVMKDNYKRYMILKFGFRMTYQEIAKFLDKPRGTVAPMMVRGYQKLKDKLNT